MYILAYEISNDFDKNEFCDLILNECNYILDNKKSNAFLTAWLKKYYDTPDESDDSKSNNDNKNNNNAHLKQLSSLSGVNLDGLTRNVSVFEQTDDQKEVELLRKETAYLKAYNGRLIRLIKNHII